MAGEEGGSGDEDPQEAAGSKYRKRDREGKDHGRKRTRRKHEYSDSESLVSSSSASSSAESSSETSDGEERRDRKKKKEKRRSHRGSDKDKTRKERSKDKRRKKRHRKDRDDDDHSEKEKKRRLLKEAKKFLKRHKHKDESKSINIQESRSEVENLSSGVIVNAQVEKISTDDYFLKSIEFATWLKEDRGVYFSELSSDQTHKIFEKFVDAWNAGRLHKKYYDGIKQAPRTNHNWAIKRRPEDYFIIDEDEEYAVVKSKEKYQRKKFQKDHENLLDEILPKATGRERLMEKKSLRREQARAREDSPEFFKERDVMGGGGDFQQRLARERARKDKKNFEKQAVYNEKLSAFEEKETAAMDQFRALVDGAGGKITIARRSE